MNRIPFPADEIFVAPPSNPSSDSTNVTECNRMLHISNSHSPASSSNSAQIAFSTRSAGVLLHPTSLPSVHGCGDLGPSAYAFVDQLSAAGVTWWQMLPTHPVGRAPGYSPYSSPSAFALSPLLISPELLQSQGLLPTRPSALPTLPTRGPVDFKATIAHRERLLRLAFADHFEQLAPQIENFAKANAHWLTDWALFAALRSVHNNRRWTEWPKPLACRDAKSLAAFAEKHKEEIAYHAFVQYLADEHWTLLRTYAATKGVKLIGDVPIFVSHDSADVWANPKLFRLNLSGEPTHVSGCPPDGFAPKGQLWGHPQYAWPEHIKTNFIWWVSRFSHMLSLFDAVRIDHFLGFYRAWVIPASAKDARPGKFLLTPGRQLFTALTKALGPSLPIIAEDLGCTSEGATILRDDFHFPGMKVLQFGFGLGIDHRPFSYTHNCVAYTGTHDNETSAGIYARLRKTNPADFANVTAMGITPAQPAWDMITQVAASVANTAIFPLQDILQLDNTHRMNIPGKPTGNWNWRTASPIPDKTIQRLRSLLTVTGRLPVAQPKPQPTKKKKAAR